MRAVSKLHCAVAGQLGLKASVARSFATVVSYNGEISSVGHPSPLRRELGRIATGYSRALSDYHFVYALHRHFALDVVVQGPNVAP